MRFPARVLPLVLLAACAGSDADRTDGPAGTPVDDQAETVPTGPEVVRGVLVLGPEVRSLKPCGEETELWVIPIEAVQEAYDALSGEPYAPVFVEVEAEREAAPPTGFGSEYPAQLRVRALRRAQPAREGFGCREDLSGFAFRAAGQEPFWGIRVTDEGITLSTPEIPSTIFEGTEPIRLDDGWRYVSTSSGPESVTMTLDLLRRDCTDSMAGSVYSWSARLEIGRDVRTGCAWEGARSPDG